MIQFLKAVRSSSLKMSVLGISLFSVGCQFRPKPPVTQGNAIPVARIDDIIISDQDLMDRVQTIEKAFPRMYSTHPQKKQLLQEMMNIELLYREALREQLDKRFEFKTKLADLYVQRLSEKVRAEITDKAIKEYYDAHHEDYDEVSARHILLKFDGSPTAAQKSALKKKIEKIRADALQKPDSFPDLAKEYSDDGSKSSGGELGFFTYRMMVAPFSEAAFALKKVGDISPVVESQFGYHVIQLSGDRRDYTNFRELIKDQLLRTTQRSRLDQELARLKNSSKMEIYEDNLMKLSPLPDEMTKTPEELIPKESPTSTDTTPKAPNAVPDTTKPKKK